MNLYLKPYFRNLIREKTTSIITIGGFAISLAIFIVIFTFVIKEKTCDTVFPDIDRMYRIKMTENTTRIPINCSDKIIASAPEIVNLCFYDNVSLTINYNTIITETTTLKTNADFFSVFSVPFLFGNPYNVLKSKENMVVTKDFSMKVFGKINSVGEIVVLQNGEKKIIKAVIENPPKNSSLQYEALVNLENNFAKSMFFFGNGVSYDTYHAIVKLALKTDINILSKKIQHATSDVPPYKDNLLSLQPYKEIYFDTGTPDIHRHANVKLIMLLGMVALIILSLTVLNYVNLSIGSNLERFKEICIRKSSGADRKSITQQFIIESYVSCSIALLLAFVFIVFFSSLFTATLNFSITPKDIFGDPLIITLSLVITFLLGTTVGYLPARIASKFNPIELMNSKSRSHKSGWTGVLNTFQFVVAIVLIASLLVVGKQINYAKSKSLGYNTQYLLQISFDDIGLEHESLKNDLLNHSTITDVSFSYGKPTKITSWASGSCIGNGETLNLENVSRIQVDTNFIKTLKIPLIAGRNFRESDEKACIINESLFKSMNWKNLDNKTVFDKEVVGVISDIHIKDLHHSIGNMLLTYKKNDYLDVMSLRILNTDIPSTIKYIKLAINNFDSELKPTIEFYDDIVNNMYQQEEKQVAIIRIFAVIAILITCMGLYGKINLSTKKRIKEIGIRKVNGASITELISLINKGTIVWIAFAFIIATPIAFFLMAKWLENFAYKTELSWWIFALAGLLALGIALLTVSWQSWKAATRNPVEALRYE